MLGTSTRPGFGSRDSGISAGPRTSSGRMIGTATSRTAPHQKCSTSQPPTIGPSAAPPEKPAAQMATASRRRLGSGKMLRIRDRVDGISMAPKNPSPARPAISHSALGAKAVDGRDGSETRAADEEQPAAADPVAQAAHRHEEAGQDQGIGVDDPEQFDAGGVEAARDGRQREGQGGVVDGHEQHRKHQQGQRQPVAPRCTRCLVDVSGGMLLRRCCCGDGSVAHDLTVPSGRYS